jgi:hypothetical protein
MGHPEALVILFILIIAAAIFICCGPSGDWPQSRAQNYMRLMEDPAKRQKLLAMLIATRISNRQSPKPPPENFEQTLLLLTHAPRRQTNLKLETIAKRSESE